MYAKRTELWVKYNLFNKYMYNVCIRFSTWKVRRMKRCRSFTVLCDKPSRIERYCRPEYKSADPNWFVRRTFHLLNSNFRFGTWKVRRLNRALAKLASYVFLFFNFFSALISMRTWRKLLDGTLHSYSVHSIEINTRREIPYLCAPMCYSIYIFNEYNKCL